jgi:hypothetical protein
MTTKQIKVSHVERLRFHKQGCFIHACARSFGILWLPDILRSYLENCLVIYREMKELIGSKCALDNTLSNFTGREKSREIRYQDIPFPVS